MAAARVSSLAATTSVGKINVLKIAKTQNKNEDILIKEANVIYPLLVPVGTGFGTNE